MFGWLRLFLTRESQNRESRETARTLVANLALGAIGLVTGIMAARLLGPDGRGRLAAIQAWPTFVGTFAVLGLPEAVVFLGGGQRERLKRLASTAFAVSVAVSALATAALWIMIPTILRAHVGSDIATARTYTLWILLGASTGVPLALIRATRMNVSWNLLRLVPPGIWLLVLVVAYARRDHNPDRLATHFLFCMVFWSAAFFIGSLYVFEGWWKGGNAHDSKPLLAFGGQVVLSDIPQMLNLRLDQLLMSVFMPPAVLGGYVVAVGWSGAFSVISAAFAAVLFPAVAEKSSEGVPLVVSALKRSLVISLCAATVLAIVTPFAVPRLFGASFTSIVPTAYVLIVATVVAGSNSVFAEGLKGLGRPGDVLKAQATALVVTGVLLTILLPMWAAFGAALASLVAYLTSSVVLVRALTRVRSSHAVGSQIDR